MIEQEWAAVTIKNKSTPVYGVVSSVEKLGAKMILVQVLKSTFEPVYCAPEEILTLKPMEEQKCR